MAETSTQSNNVAVKYRGRKEREMPTTDTLSVRAALPKIAKPAKLRMKKSIRKRVRSASKRGLISEKAMKTHIGGY